MIVEDTYISGLKVIHLEKLTDIRGSFQKVFNSDFFMKFGLETIYNESYFSVSRKNVIRGMHFQIPPYEHTKLVFLNQGELLDVVLDLRRNSITFKQFFTIYLDEKNPKLIYIPSGCAHGFLCLTDNCIVSYLQSSIYSKDCDDGILYNSFGMNWGGGPFIVSPRDLAFSSLNSFISPF